jgi:hypothetical protein
LGKKQLPVDVRLPRTESSPLISESTFSDLYSIPVHIYNETSGNFTVENVNGSDFDPIFLCYNYARGHYDSLEIIPDIYFEPPEIADQRNYTYPIYEDFDEWYALYISDQES